MINLQRTAMFVAVADTGSFTAAAEAMGLTKAVVSFNIRQLEDELGVTLLLRSTRRLTLTGGGEAFPSTERRAFKGRGTPEGRRPCKPRRSHGGVADHHHTGVRLAGCGPVTG